MPGPMMSMLACGASMSIPLPCIEQTFAQALAKRLALLFLAVVVRVGGAETNGRALGSKMSGSGSSARSMAANALCASRFHALLDRNFDQSRTCCLIATHVADLGELRSPRS